MLRRVPLDVRASRPPHHPLGAPPPSSSRARGIELLSLGANRPRAEAME